MKNICKCGAEITEQELTACNDCAFDRWQQTTLANYAMLLIQFHRTVEEGINNTPLLLTEKIE
jgi:hypothetical protein